MTSFAKPAGFIRRGINAISGACFNRRPDRLTPFEINSYHLSNGINVHFADRGDSPLTTAVVRINSTGILFDPPGKDGLSHMIEHLVARKLERSTTTFDSAYTAPDHTAYRLFSTARAFLSDISTFVDGIISPGFYEKSLHRERSTIDMEEKGVFRFGSNEELTLLLGSNFTRLSVGNSDIRGGFTLSDVKSFHSSSYSGDNIEIFISGPANHGSLLRVFERIPSNGCTAAQPAATRTPICLINYSSGGIFLFRSAPIDATIQKSTLLSFSLGNKYYSFLRLKERLERASTYLCGAYIKTAGDSNVIFSYLQYRQNGSINTPHKFVSHMYDQLSANFPEYLNRINMNKQAHYWELARLKTLSEPFLSPAVIGLDEAIRSTTKEELVKYAETAFIPSQIGVKAFTNEDAEIRDFFRENAPWGSNVLVIGHPWQDVTAQYIK